MARTKLTKVVYGGYIVLIAAFVVSSITQVSRALFGSSGSGEVRGPALDSTCSRLIAEQVRAIEHARALASEEPTGEAARTRYAAERRRSTTIDGELSRACSAQVDGEAAMATLARLDRASEARAVRTANELSPVRLAAQSFIRGDPK